VSGSGVVSERNRIRWNVMGVGIMSWSRTWSGQSIERG